MAIIGTDILRARQLLIQGEVVAIPTETVYGLAGNAYNEQAVNKIFVIKERPSFDPLIVHAGSITQIQTFVKEWPEQAEQLAQHFWPGPLTILLPKKDLIPDRVTAGLNRVAVRIPDHPLTLHLLQSLPFPLAAPSANPFGYISPTTPQHVNNQLGDRLSYILSGEACRLGIESTIIGFEQGQPTIYRLGGIPIETIEQVIGPILLSTQSSNNPQAPGKLAQHYSPTKRMIIGNIPSLIKQYETQRLGILAFDHYYPNVDIQYQVRLAPITGSLEEAASNLFAALRILDQMPIDLILGAYVPDIKLGKAINDRLKRAGAKFL